MPDSRPDTDAWLSVGSRVDGDLVEEGVAAADKELTERVLLRAVLGWVGREYPGCVARIESLVRHESMPLLWNSVAVLSNARRYRCTLALVSERIAVCVGAVRLPPVTPEDAEDSGGVRSAEAPAPPWGHGVDVSPSTRSETRSEPIGSDRWEE